MQKPKTKAEMLSMAAEMDTCLNDDRYTDVARTRRLAVSGALRWAAGVTDVVLPCLGSTECQDA